MKRLLAAVWLSLAVATAANAQVAGGSITGTVRDEQGGVLPDASVTLTGPDLSTSTTADTAGKFRFLNLAPGTYTLGAERAGFGKFVQDRINVRVGANSDLEITMKLATVQESITVGAGGQSPIADTRTTGTATNITLSELEGVPTSRDTFAVLRTVPGVLLDRVNIGGNETGQQSNAESKGTRPFDTVWTLDGIVVTEMVSTGSSPLYFNYDNFEEIQVTTAGQDITQPTGGLGVNLVVRRGSDDFHGNVRGYFTHDRLESSNIPDELRAIGVTDSTADHSQQISDYGFDLGGPLVRSRLWFYGSYSYQDVRLMRTGLADRTIIKNPNLKLNWQATAADRVSFLYFDGDREKNGLRPGGTAGIIIQSPTAVQNQHNAYGDNPFHGLWKFEDARTFGSRLFASAKVAHFNTGFELEPVGGMNLTSGRSVRLGRSFGSVNRALNLRPQSIGAIDATGFHATKAMSHDIKFGFGWRRVDAQSGTLWPGNGFLALDNSPTDRRVRVFREGRGTNRVRSVSFYAGDTIQLDSLTVNVGMRFDHQTGAALASQTAANQIFPALVPGIAFAGYDLPFAWNTVSPRAGLTWALSNRRTILRASISRYAGQMPISVPALLNPSSSVGFREYRWDDVNGDNLATPDEVLLDQFIQAGGGFNAANPTAVISANQFDPETKAPVTTSVVAGADYGLSPTLVIQSHYSYTRSINVIGNVLTRVGLTRADYAPGPNVTGTLPDGLSYDIPTFIPDINKIAAGGGGFVAANWHGYYSDYHGMEASIVKRMDRWGGRVGLAWNNAREHYSPEGLYDNLGNPTRTESEPLLDGGQYAPTPGNDVFVNAKWQLNTSLAYIAPGNVQVAVNVFGRQGYPFVPFRQVALGADAVRMLVTPRVDTYRLQNVWDTDVRVARSFAFRQANLQVIGDLFNVFNANTPLVLNRNAAAPTFRAIAQNLSPRIFRIGLRLGF